MTYLLICSIIVARILKLHMKKVGREVKRDLGSYSVPLRPAMWNNQTIFDEFCEVYE